MEDKVPDETTILNFRHLIEKNGLGEKIFKRVNTLLKREGILLEKGTIVDATLIKAPQSRKNKEKKRDPEMSSTKKGENWTFGMKMHIGVDASSGLIHSCIATTAQDSDRSQFTEMLQGGEKAIFGDKGYVNKEDKQVIREEGVYRGVLDRAGRDKKLSNK